MSKYVEFKKKFDFEKRISESNRVKTNYPKRIPVIVEKSDNNDELPQIDKIKYLVPNDMTLSQFMAIVRKRLLIKPEQALFMMTENKLLTGSQLMDNIYKDNVDADGFLYMKYFSENTFG